MRGHAAILLGLVLACGGCRGGGIARVDDQKQPFNRWTVNTMDDESVGNAIIAQHTLYPYHFVDNSPNLNALGERDMKVLAHHFAKNPGELNVRRAGVSKELYEARVQSVTNCMIHYGVPQQTIKIADKLPGGDGVPGDRAVIILQRSYSETTLFGDSSSANANQNGKNSSGTSSSSDSSGMGGSKE